jgi:hypothetical protein
MILRIDNRLSEYHFGTELISLDVNGRHTVSTFHESDDVIDWINSPKIIVFDELDNEVIIDTQRVNITGFNF